MADPVTVFDTAAEGYDLDRQHASLSDQLVAGIQRSSPTGLVIDVATGTGAAAFSALRRLEPDRVVAIDICRGCSIGRKRKQLVTIPMDGSNGDALRRCHSTSTTEAPT